MLKVKNIYYSNDFLMENCMQKTETEYKMKSITLPAAVVKEIEKEAKKNSRSFSGEVSHRIKKTLEEQKGGVTV